MVDLGTSSDDKSAGIGRPVTNEIEFNAAAILDSYDTGIHGDQREYFTCYNKLKNFKNDSTKELIAVLRGFESVVTRLTRKHEHELVAVLLELPWTEHGAQARDSFSKFLCALLAVHNYYIDHALLVLLKLFYPRITDNSLSKDRERVDDVLQILGELIGHVPKVTSHVLSALRPIMLHARKPYVFCTFVSALLQLVNLHIPRLRGVVYRLLVESMRAVDAKLSPAECGMSMEDGVCVNSPDELLTQLYNLQSENSVVSVTHVKLDALMWLLLNDVKSCVSSGSVVHIHKCLLGVFHTVLLHTEVTSHLHFFMFYLSSLQEDLQLGFLNYLWKRVVDPSLGDSARFSVISYLVDLVARAKFVGVHVLRQTLRGLRDFAVQYLKRCNDTSSSSSYSRHAIFHTLCHSIMYLCWFRQEDILQESWGRKYCQQVEQQLLASRLNPLKFASESEGDGQVLWLTGFECMMRMKLESATCQALMEMNRMRRLMGTTDEQGQAPPLLHPFSRYSLPWSAGILQVNSHLRAPPVSPDPQPVTTSSRLRLLSLNEEEDIAGIQQEIKKIEEDVEDEEDRKSLLSMNPDQARLQVGRKRKRVTSEVLLLGELPCDT